MPSVAETRQEVVHLVLPEHGNLYGNLFGGRMMAWIASAATLVAMRLARGNVVLGSMDDLDFLAPVRVGDLVVLRAQVEHVGRASMEVGVEVEAEQPRTGERRRATTAHLALVAVDEAGRPRPVGVAVEPATAEERVLAERARARKLARMQRLADRRERARDVAAEPEELRFAAEVSRLVFPEDAVGANMLFAGTLLQQLDECASIQAVRYARGPVVTASLDALDFYAPIFVGEIVTYRTAINYVGRTSMEIGVKVLAENPRTGELRHTCTAFLTAVHVGPDGRPAPLPPYEPQTAAERRRWQAAAERRQARQARLAGLRGGGGASEPEIAGGLRPGDRGMTVP